jgi:hypothetical protein
MAHITGARMGRTLEGIGVEAVYKATGLTGTTQSMHIGKNEPSK